VGTATGSDRVYHAVATRRSGFSASRSEGLFAQAGRDPLTALAAVDVRTLDLHVRPAEVQRVGTGDPSFVVTQNKPQDKVDIVWPASKTGDAVAPVPKS
jgi:hypothetical protein